MRDLDGKTAFVTGGASGIGLAMGRAFAEAGMRVMLADIEAKPLEQTVAAFNLAEVRGVVCDVRDHADVERAAQVTIDAFGKVHVLCNNAGVSGARAARHWRQRSVPRLGRYSHHRKPAQLAQGLRRTTAALDRTACRTDRGARSQRNAAERCRGASVEGGAGQ
jgi:NAD(P)-dependent dehydrogenase (short-subunit alcohol dehydrogenase family)